MSSVGHESRQLLIKTQRGDSKQILRSVANTGIVLDPTRTEHRLKFLYARTEEMGMGLSISRSIIEAHRGRLWGHPECWTGRDNPVYVPLNSGVRGHTHCYVLRRRLRLRERLFERPKFRQGAETRHNFIIFWSSMFTIKCVCWHKS